MQPSVMENKSQLRLFNVWCNWSGGFQELLYNTKVIWKKKTLEGPSRVKRLKIMARCMSLLETIFTSLSLGIKHHYPDISHTSVGCLKKSLESCCYILSSSHPLQALQRGVWSPQILSVTGGETYLQRVSGHLRSSPTLRRAENNLDPNIWIEVSKVKWTGFLTIYLHIWIVLWKDNDEFPSVNSFVN